MVKSEEQNKVISAFKEEKYLNILHKSKQPGTEKRLLLRNKSSFFQRSKQLPNTIEMDLKKPDPD